MKRAPLIAFAVLGLALAAWAAKTFPASARDLLDKANDEGNVLMSANVVRRSPKLVGANDFSSAGNNLPSSRKDAASVIYRGNLYVMGGTDFASGAPSANVYRAPITGGIVGAFTQMASLSTPRTGASAVLYDGKIYVAGGETTGATVLGSVELAFILSDGTLSAWTATTSFSPARKFASMVGLAGRLWLLGGENSTGALTEIHSATVNANGTLTAWQASGLLPVPRSRAGAAVDESFIYLVGGRNASATTATVAFGKIGGGQVQNWASAPALPQPLERLAVIGVHGHIYAMGGDSGAGFTSSIVYRAPMLGGGGTGPWLLASSVPGTVTAGMAAATDGRNLFLSGGEDAASSTAAVRSASLDSTGAISPWIGTQPLNSAIDSAPAIAFEGQAFLFGGRNGATVLSGAQRAPIGAPWSVGAFSSAGNPPTSTRELSAAVVAEGLAVWIGGKDAAGAAMNLVEAAPVQSGGTFGTWTTLPALLTARHSHAAVTANGRIYVFGGNNGTGSLSSVEQLSYQSGAIVAAALSTPLSTAREGLSAAAQGRFIYLTGGRSGASTYLGTVDIAQVQTDGSLVYTAGPSLPAPRAFHQSLIYEGYLYVLGGLPNGGAAQVVHRARIANDGTLESWRPTRSFPALLSHFGAVASNGSIHVVGGRDSLGSSMTSVMTAPVAGHGLADAWFQQTQASLPSPLYLHATAASSRYVFALGGSAQNGTLQSKVYRSTATNGQLSAWTDTGAAINTAEEGLAAFIHGDYLYTVGGSASGRGTKVSRIKFDQSTGAFTTAWSDLTNGNETLPDARVYHSLATYNGYEYLVGGQLSAGVSNVLFAQLPAINGTGTPTWSPAAVSLPVDLAKGCAVGYNGYLYVVGGRVGSSVTTSKIWAAPLSATTGNLSGPFVETEPMLAPRKGHSCYARDGYLYVVGGDQNSTPGRFYSAVEIAPILPGGGLGKFTALGSLPNPITQGSGVLVGDFIHIVGGQTGAASNTAVATTYTLKLYTPAARGNYSALTDLGFQASVLTGITLFGDATHRGRVAQLDYTVGGASGSYFTGNTFNPASPVNIINSFLHSNVRYVWLRATLDDRFSATADPLVTRDVTDLRFEYTPFRQLVVTTPSRTTAVSGCSLAVTVELQDGANVKAGYGSLVTLTLKSSSATMSFFSDANCQTPVPQSQIDVAAGEDTKTFYFSDSAVGTPTVFVTSNQVDLEPGSQGQSIISALPELPAQLGFISAAQTVMAGACSGATNVQLQLADGGSAASNGATALDVSASGVSLYADPQCQSALTSPSIPNGTDSFTFWFSDTVAGSKPFTVSVVGADGGGGVLPAQQTNIIEPADPVDFTFLTPAHTVAAGSCSPAITVALKDAFDNAAFARTATSLALSSDTTSVTLYSDGSCTTATTALAFGVGESTKSFHFKGAMPSTPAIGAALGSATHSQRHTVQPAPLAAFNVTGFPSPVIAGEPEPFTVEAIDATGNRAVGYVGAVSFRSTDPNAVLPPTTTFTAADQGVLQLTATFKTAGKHDLEAYESTVSGKQTKILVVAAAPQTLILSGPATAEVGQSATVTLRATDDFDNPVDAPVKLTVSGGGAISAASFDGAAQPAVATGTILADGSSTATLSVQRPEKITVCGELGESKPCLAIAPRLTLPNGESVVAVSLGAGPDGVLPASKLTAKVTVSAPSGFALPAGLALSLTGDGLAIESATIPGAPLSPTANGFALPAIKASGTLTVDVPVVVATTGVTEVTLTAVLVAADGTQLTEPVNDSAQVRALGTDVGGVGCGCSSGGAGLLPFALSLLLLRRRRWG